MFGMELLEILTYFIYALPFLGTLPDDDPSAEDGEERPGWRTNEDEDPDLPDLPDESPSGTSSGNTPAEGKSETDANREIRSANFRRQCFLINYWESILKSTGHHLRGIGGYEPYGLTDYKNISCINGNPTTLVNEIHCSRPRLDRFFDMTNAQQSALVPHVRLHKVFFIDGIPDPDRAPQEFIFQQSLDIGDLNAMMKSRRGRASGVGLVSVDIDDQSTMIGETNKRFEVTLKFRFQTMEDILKVINPGAPDSSKLRWVDLISPPPTEVSALDPNSKKPKCKELEDGNNVWNPDFFIIRGTFGWGAPPPKMAQRLGIGKDLRAAIKATKKTFFMGLINHTFEFSEDGTVEMTASFQAFTAAAFSSNNYSDLLFPAMNKKERILLEKERRRIFRRLQRLERKNDYATDRETRAAAAESGQDLGQFQERHVDTLKKGLSNTESQLRIDKAMRYNVILRRLVRADTPSFSMWVKKESIYDAFSPSDADPKIFEADVAPSLLRTATSIEALASEADSDKDVASEVKKRILTSDDIKEQKKRSSDASYVEINFTFLGDLLDTVCEALRDNSGGMFDTRLLLGPALVYMGPPGKRQLKVVNLADLPISIKSFEVFWLEKVVKQMRDTYKMNEFLRDMINEFLIQVLDSDCLDRENIQKKVDASCEDPVPMPRKNVALDFFSMNRKTNTQDASIPGEPPIPIGKKIQLDNETIKNFRLDNYKPASDVFHYAFLYMVNPELKGFNGDRMHDHERGIYHLFIGRDRGIVKNMKFTKIDDPNLKAAQLVKNLDEGSVLPIPEPYNVSIKTFGNALFKPGQKIYVVPSFAGGTSGGTQELAKRLLIGGYYTIIKVKATLNPASFDTEIEAMWESSGRGPGSKEETSEHIYFDYRTGEPSIPLDRAAAREEREAFRAEEEARRVEAAAERQRARDEARDDDIGSAAWGGA
jgi:hypothetical protein